MVKGFIRLIEKFSEENVYLRIDLIQYIIPVYLLPGFSREDEGSVIYMGKYNVFEKHVCVAESPDSVMTLMETAEMEAEKKKGGERGG